MTVGPSRVPSGAFLGRKGGGGSIFLACGVLLFASSCTFEPRDPEPDPLPDSATTAAAEGILPPVELSEAAAVQTVEHFRASVANGDISRALGLVDGDATLVDALAGVEADAIDSLTRGELLLELRRRHAEGVTLVPLATSVTLFPGETALLVSRIQVFEAGPEDTLEPRGLMHETVVLFGTPDGWRIRSFHRSFLPGSSLPNAGPPTSPRPSNL